MDQLERTLGEVYAPKIRWIMGTIDTVTGDTVTLFAEGGYIPNVGCLDQYVPVAGDSVHALSFEGNGVLVIGSNNKPGTEPSSPVTPGAALTVTPSSSSVYDATAGVWAAGTGAGPTLTKVWFYTGGAFSTMAGRPIGAVEIEITRTSGGPPEMVALTNTSAAGVPTPITYTASRYGIGSSPVGVPTWLPLPLEWGMGLADGTIKSIGVGGALYAGVYAGTGRVRITPL